MEKPASFDLNDSLRQWRMRVTSSPAFRNENVDELDAHLRDSLGRLQAGGLSEEEAWVIAQKRIGQIDSLEQEFAKLAESSTPAPARRSARLVRSFAAVGTGAVVTMLLSYVAEWSAFQPFFNGSYSHPGASEKVVQEWGTSAQLGLLGVLAGSLVGGYITALIARHRPMKHAATASALVWSCMTVLRGLQAGTWLLWGSIGAAIASAMFLGAMLCERYRPRWRWPVLTDEDYRRLARRAGGVSIGFMAAGIVVGFIARIIPSEAFDWLHSIEVWLLWGTLMGWSVALGFIGARRLKSRKTTRLAS
jgi:hypothetical protein